MTLYDHVDQYIGMLLSIIISVAIGFKMVKGHLNQCVYMGTVLLQTNMYMYMSVYITCIYACVYKHVYAYTLCI